MLKEHATHFYLEDNCNCAEAILMAANAEYNLGLRDDACKLVGGFGAGVSCGSTCGALTGALMVLGALGYGEAEARNMIQQFRQANGCTDCAGLLVAAKERQQVKKENCDDLVYQCIAALKEVAGK